MRTPLGKQSWPTFPSNSLAVHKLVKLLKIRILPFGPGSSRPKLQPPPRSRDLTSFSDDTVLPVKFHTTA